MTENSVDLDFSQRRLAVSWPTGIKTVLVAVLVCIAMASVVVMETRFSGIEADQISVGETPVTVYSQPARLPAPPVIVAHGFAGSRQMMDQIAVSLARQGFVVASVDLPGQGRNLVPMSPDITRIEGTTAELVAAVETVADVISNRPDTTGPVSFVGHSMATDVIIRAAKARDDTGAVVAISMYSPAVTATAPANLLVLSGATESHLREAGLAAARLVNGAATEGETVAAGQVQRRTAAAPYVGHVGVLYSPTTLEETTRWIRQVTDAGQVAPLDKTGWIAALLLASLVVLVWPLSTLIPSQAARSPTIPGRIFLIAILIPIPVAVVIALAPTIGIAGYASFGSIAMILGVTGTLQLVLLNRAGVQLGLPRAVGLVLYLAFGLVFALALDRYGAAFIPIGQRGILALVLILGTVPLMLADTLMAQSTTLLRRVLLRLSLLVSLGAAMALSPIELGLTFTIVPVLLLFFIVYGTIGRWIAARQGIEGVALGKGLFLAWAIAASTPLFAA